jgi:D-3-phosphoglycerate dehydrogenase
LRKEAEEQEQVMHKIATLNKISPKGLNLFTKDYELVSDVSQAEAVIVRSHNMHEDALPDGLLAIARAGAGVNNIPVERCSEFGVVVFNTPGANANAVKELVLTAMLMASRNMIPAIEWTKTLENDAPEAIEKNKSRFAGMEIAGKRLAVIGLGYIGVMVANAAERLGMKVAGYDPYISVKSAHDLSPNVRIFDTIEALLPSADFVTIHVPATPKTQGMFDYKLLSAMRHKAVLLNFARGSLVDTDDLKRVLAEKKLRLYITDFPSDDLFDVRGHQKVAVQQGVADSQLFHSGSIAVCARAVKDQTEHKENQGKLRLG